ncbi:MAG TPA: hypothetical protein VKY57_03780 [Chitinispirillaceae bacterium]|nr:hypothetical protein [Chitinispirillaceae bacterium]
MNQIGKCKKLFSLFQHHFHIAIKHSLTATLSCLTAGMVVGKMGA